MTECLHCGAEKDKGQNPNASPAVSLAEETLMWERGQLGDSTSKVLTFSLWYFFTKCFGIRGHRA